MNSFDSRGTLASGDKSYTIYRLPALAAKGFNLSRLPFSLKILLENLLRREDGVNVTAGDICFLATWNAKAEPSREIAYMPARVLMQDFTGVPAVVDLGAMRDAIKTLGGDPNRVNPLIPAELVIDHSVQVDEFGAGGALAANTLLEFQRNRERYAFLKWGQTAFRNFSAVPPGMGICHQVNLEYLARVVFTTEIDGATVAYPDTVVGTDSHTTMINGLGVLGWGVGGIEAEAAMLGQAVSMLVPQVVGFRLTGKLKEGTTATDLVLTITQALRKLGVVGKFVEFYGPGIAELPLADRATISNMAPEYGATCGIFPVDAETLRYLRLTGRGEDQIALVEAYYKEQGLFHTADSPEAEYTQTLELDLATVEPSVAGPKRPQDRVLLKDAAASFEQQLPGLLSPTAKPLGTRTAAAWKRESVTDTGLAEKVPVHLTGHVSRSRVGGDCGNYKLHEYFESFGDGGGGDFGQEGCRKGPHCAAVGEDFAGAGLARGDGLLHEGWVAAVSRKAALQRGGVWLHHLHRQLGAAADGCFKVDRRARTGCGERAERQSQLRGARECGRACQLFDVAAAGGRLRACRQDRA